MATTHMTKGLARGLAGIVTGASTGIGKALCLELAAKYNARLVINARTESDLNAVADAIVKAGGEVATVCGDVSNWEVIESLVNTARSRFGDVDMLINNAGFAKPGPLPSLTPEDWESVFAVNFFAPVRLTYRLLPDFIQRGSGKIVNVASVAGKVAMPGSVCYAASKFALTGFSEGMAAELGKAGIDVITVCPGLVRTEFFRKNNNSKDITAMAEEPNLSGWVVKNLLSISSEQASHEIIKACELGGCREIVLTHLGQFLERLNGYCPPAAWWLSSFVPADRGARPKETSTPGA
jgi:short-subunit dehydrogenase